MINYGEKLAAIPHDDIFYAERAMNAAVKVFIVLPMVKNCRNTNVRQHLEMMIICRLICFLCHITGKKEGTRYF